MLCGAITCVWKIQINKLGKDEGKNPSKKNDLLGCEGRIKISIGRVIVVSNILLYLVLLQQIFFV